MQPRTEFIRTPARTLHMGWVHFYADQDYLKRSYFFSPLRLRQPQGPPTVTVTLAGPDGAIVWYALEAVDDSALCEARAMAARVAPNLTLAADDAWLHAMELQARPSSNPSPPQSASCRAC